MCNHNVMLKLSHLLRKRQIIWLCHSYLSHRKICAQLDIPNSPLPPGISGVPEASLVGRLLYPIYSNNLPYNSPVRCRFFRRLSHRVFKYLVNMWPGNPKLFPRSRFRMVSIWQMSSNTAKCRQITFTRKKPPLGYIYRTDNTEISLTTQFKYLEIIITSNLCRKNPINNIVSSATKKTNDCYQDVPVTWKI